MQAANAGVTDTFVAKLNPAGAALIYSTYLGGTGEDRGQGIAVDTGGSAYLTGDTDSTDFPTANALYAANPGGTDAFVAKISVTTAVYLRSFAASRSGRLVVLRWRTGSDISLVGFHVYRQQRGKLVKLNRALIPSVFGGTTSGHGYSWLDRTGPRGGTLTYRLQAVNLDGTRRWVGAASVRLSTTSGRCSRAAAIEVVKRLHLGNADYSPNPVGTVLCGAFTGPQSQAMAALLFSGGTSITLGFAVFRWAGGEWQLVMESDIATTTIEAAGSDIREISPVWRRGDPHCCPSGGTQARIWHWNGTRFTASAWKQATPGKAETHAGFKTPRGVGVQCTMNDDPQRSYANVRCQSGSSSLAQVVNMGGAGRLTICRDRSKAPFTRNRCKLWCGCDEIPDPTLGYGKQITIGRFHCLSERSGVTCTVTQSGKGFLINSKEVSRVAP